MSDRFSKRFYRRPNYSAWIAAVIVGLTISAGVVAAVRLVALVVK